MSLRGRTASFQHGEELSAKAGSGIRPDPNDVRGPLAIPHRKPDGHGVSRKELPASIPKVV